MSRLLRSASRFMSFNRRDLALPAMVFSQFARAFFSMTPSDSDQKKSEPNKRILYSVGAKREISISAFTMGLSIALLARDIKRKEIIPNLQEKSPEKTDKLRLCFSGGGMKIISTFIHDMENRIPSKGYKIYRGVSSGSFMAALKAIGYDHYSDLEKKAFIQRFYAMLNECKLFFIPESDLNRYQKIEPSPSEEMHQTIMNFFATEFKQLIELIGEKCKNKLNIHDFVPNPEKITFFQLERLRQKLEELGIDAGIGKLEISIYDDKERKTVVVSADHPELKHEEITRVMGASCAHPAGFLSLKLKDAKFYSDGGRLDNHGIEGIKESERSNTTVFVYEGANTITRSAVIRTAVQFFSPGHHEADEQTKRALAGKNFGVCIIPKLGYTTFSGPSVEAGILSEQKRDQKTFSR